VATRVLLADDHTLVRQGLGALLAREGFEVVAECGDGRDALAAAREARPDVAILDFSMPLLNGVDAAREMKSAAPATAVVLVTVHAESPYVLAALEAGVRGYVLKKQSADELVSAIRAVLRGESYLSPGVSGVVMEACVRKGESENGPLTSRERQVLQLVAEGKTTRKTAEILGISPKTVESHRTRLMKKLGVHETAGLVRQAIRLGLVEA
jgi:two-component system response regulator NreC